MGERQGREWRSPSVIVGVATFVAALGTLWLTFAIGYTGNPGFAAWVESVVASVGPMVSRMAGVLGSFLVAVGAGVVANLVARFALEFNWRERWKKWRREKHVSASYRAAGPVRHDVLSKLSGKADTPPQGPLDSQMKQVIGGLEDDQLQVFEAFLEKCLAGWGRASVRDAEVGLTPVSSASEADERFDHAVEKLAEVGLLRHLEPVYTQDGFSTDGIVADAVSGIDVQVVLDMVREELRSRGIAELSDRVFDGEQRAAQKEPAEKSGRSVMDWKWDTLTILQRLLSRALKESSFYASLMWPFDYELEPPARWQREAWDRLSNALKELKTSRVVEAESEVSRPAEGEMLRSVGEGGVLVHVRFVNRDLAALGLLMRDVDAEVIVRSTEGFER